ncbi:hypothetical protein REPUB_Repub07fG0105900 [Reevesia pubescens]
MKGRLDDSRGHENMNQGVRDDIEKLDSGDNIESDMLMVESGSFNGMETSKLFARKSMVGLMMEDLILCASRRYVMELPIWEVGSEGVKSPKEHRDECFVVKDKQLILDFINLKIKRDGKKDLETTEDGKR